ncbi:TIM barrel protein [Phaeovibrio sulfidiphilus]|uniref:TIM barrel protein n=1 Tax=Phaeovibrio sulfidiphilus TaxID=1220600 RepID=A0A8J6Z0K4_9PROT|nr:TIM barrel protein [Phaeovibrio sulfidiphilus]MBE1237688.1 TIM barrel protein [Phaeovibrio sulfidiphilus]
MSCPLKIGFTLYEGQDSALAARLETIAGFGADLAELSMAPLNTVIGGRVNTPRLKSLVPVVSGFPGMLTLHAPLSLSMMDPDHIEAQSIAALSCLDVCATLGAKLLVVHPGWISTARFERERSDLMAIERDGLEWLARQAASRGVTVCLENMPVTREVTAGDITTYGLDPVAVAAQVEAVNHPNLRAVIDFSHAYLASRHFGWDLAERVSVLAPLARHLHLHDSFGRPPTHWENLFPGDDVIFGEGDLHLPLGWGDLPFETVMGSLTFSGAPSATLEIGMGWHEDSAMRDSLSRARAYLQQARIAR